eukprot:COSAG06_NODE_12768_length_1332_cov_1.245742_2_plen_55_part_00
MRVHDVKRLLCGVDGVDVSVECSKTECLGQFDQTWAENRMAKLNEMDGAVRNII